MSGNAPGIEKRKRAGGAATAMGMNFQAVATAYVCVCMLEEESVAWLDRLCAEPPVPVAVIPESGGPGDDIRIEFKGGLSAEVQVKKGLRADDRLWESLDALALAIHDKTLAYGVLVVDPQSSKSVRIDLARDIIDVGKGWNVPTKGHIATWKSRLEAKSIPLKFVCERMRIKIFHGTEVDSGDVENAKKALKRLMVPGNTPESAWPVLLDEVMSEMASSGRMTSDSLAKLFARKGFPLNSKVCSAALHAQYRGWVEERNSTFVLPGVRTGLALSNRLPVQFSPYTHSSRRQESLESAMRHYRASVKGVRPAKRFDIEGIARFRKHVVIVAGPGLGKTLALKALANRYSVDGYFVLSVELKRVAKAWNEGKTFKCALVDLAVDSSRLSREAFLSIDPCRWVLLADGLDECGGEHGAVACELRAFVSGNPGMRAVITTRPVGYHTHELEKWVHYEIVPPAKEDGPANLAKLMIAVAGVDPTPGEYERLAGDQLRKSPASDSISTSPMLLGMSAYLLLESSKLPEIKTDLYVQFLRLYDNLPSGRSGKNATYARKVLNALGWFLRKKPAAKLSELQAQCVDELVLVTDLSSCDAEAKVHEALEHWQRLGLVELLNHQSTEFLTFTHLSFAEFLAARHLLDHQPRLLGEVAYDVQWQEVLGYAVELGMKPSLADDLLERHDKRDPKALNYALIWSSKFPAAASFASLERLICASIAALDRSVSVPESLHLSVGHGLCKMAPKGNPLLAQWVSQNVESPEPSLRLIAWSLASQCAIALPETLDPRSAFHELLAIHGKPFDVHDILEKRVRHEALLLQYVALMAVKSCSREQVEAFTDSLSGEERLQRPPEFQFQIMKIRDDHGIKDKPTRPTRTWRDSYPRFELSQQQQGRLRDSQRRVARLLAEAFCRGAAKDQCGAFPQFAAFIASAAIDHYNLREEFGDEEPGDTISFGSTLRDFALFQGLDLAELAEEARAVLYRLDTEPHFSLFDELPLVDVDLNEGVGCSTPKVNVEHAKRNLLAGSKKAQHLAAVLLLQITLCEESLSELLNDAEGPALGLVCLLIERNRPDRSIEMLVGYLQRSDCQQPDYILQSLERLRPSLTDELERLTLGYLTHANPDVVVSAIDLVKVWVQDEHFSRVVLVEQALECWKDHTNVHTHFDRDVRLELKDLREAMAAVE